MRKSAWPRERLPECFYQTARQGSGAFHRNLLAENCPDRQLETIPAARYTQPRICLQVRRQYRVRRQTLGDGRPIRIQIEHRPYALDDREERARIAKLNTHGEAVISAIR